MRALAQRSSDAARDIRALITNSSTQVSQGVDLVGQTGRMLERIGTKIAEVNALVDAIAKGAELQADTLGDIGKAVISMDQMVQQNAAMVEQTAAAARSLASEAEELSGLTGRFRLKGGAKASARRAVSSQPAMVSASAPPASPAPRLAALPPVSGNLALSPAPSGDDWAEF